MDFTFNNLVILADKEFLQVFCDLREEHQVIGSDRVLLLLDHISQRNSKLDWLVVQDSDQLANVVTQIALPSEADKHILADLSQGFIWGEDTRSLDEGILNDLLGVLLEVAGQSELPVITIACCLLVHDVGESSHNDHEVLTSGRDVRMTNSSQEKEKLLLLKQRAPVVLRPI